MARVELENSVRFARKISERLDIVENGRSINVDHFSALVPTPRGDVLKFHDAGSKAVRIRTSRYPQEP